MRAYFVRLAEDQQAVGIFAADDVDALAVLVDECCDPSGCEYREVGAGGIFQPRGTKAKFPVRYIGENPHPDDASPFADADYSDSWSFGLDGEWRSIANDL